MSFHEHTLKRLFLMIGENTNDLGMEDHQQVINSFFLIEIREIKNFINND